MMISRLLMTTSLCAAWALPSAASPQSFSSLDVNGDEKLSQTELEAAFGTDGAANILNKNDSDGDGYLTRDEIKSARDADDDDGDEGDEGDETDEGDEGDESDDSDEDSDESDSDESDDSDESSDSDDSDES